jgi:2-methylcitrate dehydratase PrpD
MSEQQPVAGEGVTARLAAFVTDTRLDQIPAVTQHAAKRALVDVVGVALGAAEEPAVRIAREVARALGGAPQATLWGTAERTSLIHAARVAGIMAHVLDYDDTHLPTILHPSAPVAAAALPVAEWRRASGAELLTAFVVGFEVAARVALSVCPAHYDAGWHVTGTAGVFGAAAAAARLLGLDARHTAWALGAAAAQAAGLREMFGSMCKSLHAGKAAENGVLAALLAREGFTAPAEPLAGRRGFGAVLSTRFDPAALTEALAERWEVHRNAFKPYACGVVTHPAIDAARQLRAQGYEAAALARLELHVHPLVLELCGKRAPQTGLEGKFSVYHCAAVGFLDDAAGPAQFTDAVVRRPDVVALRERVTATADPALAEDQARLVAHLVDGRPVEIFVPHASGTLENPLSDEALAAKFRAVTAPVLGAERAGALLGRLWRLEAEPDAAALAALLAA